MQKWSLLDPRFWTTYIHGLKAFHGDSAPRSGPELGPEVVQKVVQEEESLVQEEDYPAQCTSLPCPILPCTTLPYYTSLGTPVYPTLCCTSPLHRVLTAVHRGPGITLWAQAPFLSLGNLLLSAGCAQGCHLFFEESSRSVTDAQRQELTKIGWDRVSPAYNQPGMGLWRK